jgi:Zn-dependent protease
MNHIRPSGPSLRFEAFGVPINVNWSLPLLGATIAYIPARHADGSSVANYLAVFFCLLALLVLHELGHALAAKVCSLKVRAIILSGYGGCCIADAPTRLSHAALFASGGLLAQLLVLAATLGVLLASGASPSNAVVNSAVFTLVGVNIFFMLANLAPYRGSDGAQLLAVTKRALSERLHRGA